MVKKSKPEAEGLIFVVGCGGIGYHAASMLSVMIRSLKWPVLLFDPDRVEKDNWRRQWPGTKAYKTSCMRKALGLLLDIRTYEKEFCPEDITTGIAMFEGVKKVVAFGWPDNDEARLDLMNGLAYVEAGRVLGVCGANAIDSANAYGFVSDNGEILVDLRSVVKLDMERSANEEDCNAQTAMANQMAALLSFLVCRFYSQEWEPGDVPFEWLWHAEMGITKRRCAETKENMTRRAETETSAVVAAEKAAVDKASEALKEKREENMPPEGTPSRKL